jgi:putative endopeptidase
VDTIDHHIDSGDVYSLLAYINQDEVVSWQCPISWSVSPDEKDVSKYITHITPPQLGLYDYMIYIDDPASSASEKRYKKEYKTKYLDFIKKTFDACLGGAKHNKFNPQDVWDVEYELLMAMGCGEVKNENANYYNPLTLSEVENDYHFDLTEFTKKLGYKTPPKRVIISSLSAFKCIVKLVEKNWNTDKWRTYWIFMWFKQMIRFQEEWRDIYFDFYGKYVEGQTVKMPIDTYSIFGLSFSFNTFLTEQYVNHKRNPTYVNYVKQLVEDLKQVFIRRVNRNTWLSPSTKKAALRKLEKLYVVVGSPDKMRNDPVLDYTNDNPWHNMLTLAKWKHKKFIELEGKEVIDIPQIDWNKFKLVGTQAYMVNAYYRPTSNSIYVPLAYLQKPFIDLDERGIEYNMAYIGYTLGHELSHSLDDNGSKFDENGNLNNWWTDEDRKKFKRKIDDVIKQYEEFAKRDGIEFDAEIGVGEDIADIAGLSLAEEYLLDFQKVNDDIDIIKKISLEAFYVYSAVQSRQKISKQALPAQLKTNPHPLEKYRCNCHLSRLQLFRSIYNVKKDDDMWWHNTDTVW